MRANPTWVGSIWIEALGLVWVELRPWLLHHIATAELHVVLLLLLIVCRQHCFVHHHWLLLHCRHLLRFAVGGRAVARIVLSLRRLLGLRLK